jgi:hypothetical protein
MLVRVLANLNSNDKAGYGTYLPYWLQHPSKHGSNSEQVSPCCARILLRKNWRMKTTRKYHITAFWKSKQTEGADTLG